MCHNRRRTAVKNNNDNYNNLVMIKALILERFKTSDKAVDLCLIALKPIFDNSSMSRSRVMCDICGNSNDAIARSCFAKMILLSLPMI